MKTLLTQIENFIPYNEQEEKDKQVILHAIKTQKDILSRKNKLAHLSASAWVLNKERTKVLMAYHNIYDSWSWLGGHADEESNLLEVAIREVKEESGVTSTPIHTDIFSLEIVNVEGHEKKGEYVNSHLHLNVTYLLEADEKDPLQINEDENSNVGWFLFQDAIQASSELWFQERIYQKLNDKVRNLLK